MNMGYSAAFTSKIPPPPAPTHGSDIAPQAARSAQNCQSVMLCAMLHIKRASAARCTAVGFWRVRCVVCVALLHKRSAPLVLKHLLGIMCGRKSSPKCGPCHHGIRALCRGAPSAIPIPVGLHGTLREVLRELPVIKGTWPLGYW